MADSFILTDGTTSIELKYDPGTQDAYRITYGTRVQQMMPDVLVHEPDDGESLPVRAVDRDRQIFTELQVVADTWDEVLNKVTELRRLLDQGLRYWIDGDVERVTFRIQLDGATRYTDWPVKWGFIDDSASYYTTAQNKIAWDLVIGMTVSPYGEGAPFTLRNDLASSPHFIEDSNSDGLADGWNLTAAPTPTISTTYYLVGGQSQKITTDASTGQALFSDSVTVATTTDLVAYIWVYAAASGNDPLTVRLYDGSNNVVESKTFNPASPTGYDKTATGAAGETWYRYSFISTATRTAANAYIAVLRSGGTQVTEFYADAAYMETSQDTVPAAWSSTASIENRYDPVSSDEARINYIDVWGVPGDADAVLDQALEVDYVIVGQSATKLVAGKSTGLIGDFQVHFVDSSSIGSTGSTIADNTRIGGSYTRVTGTGAAVEFDVNLGGTPDEAYKILQNGARLFAVVKTSTTVIVENGTTGKIDFIGDAVSVNTGGNWDIVDLGLIRSQDTFMRNYTTSSTVPDIAIKATVPSAQTFELDGVYFIPVEEIIVGYDINQLVSGSIRYILGSESAYYYAVTIGKSSSYLGSLFFAAPGRVYSRYVYLFYAVSAVLDKQNIEDSHIVTLTVTPRTRHLLGTV